MTDFYKTFQKFCLCSWLGLLILGSSTTLAKETVLPQNTRPLHMVTSFYPIYIMTLNVTHRVPDVTVNNLTSSTTGCLHDYALTPHDMKKLEKADIFIANGAGMESFLDRIVSPYPNLKIITLADHIKLLQDKSGKNPHVWVSISHAITEVLYLDENLEKLDSIHAKQYHANREAYVKKLKALRQKMQTALAPYRGTSIITFHEAFPYFAEEFGLKIAAVIEREPGSEPSARELAETIETIKKLRIKLIFTEPQYSPLSAQTISKETGAKLYVLDPCVTGPYDPDAYIKSMENNLKVLQHAFSEA